MGENSLFNLSFDPIVPSSVIVIISILLLYLIFFVVINKIQGGFFRITIFLIFTILLIQPSLKIEKRKIENNILTFVIDDTLSQKISGRSEQIQSIYKNILKTINNKHSKFDVLEIRISNEKITKRFGKINDILNNAKIYEEKKSINKNSTYLLDIFNEEVNKYPLKKLSTAFFLTDGQMHDLENNNIIDKLDIPIYFILPEFKNFSDQKLTVNYAPDYGYVGENISFRVIANDYSTNNNKNIKLKVFKPDQTTEDFILQNNIEKKINFKISRTGENIFYLNIESEIEDLSRSNNFKIVRINAIRKTLQVLLVSGEPYMGTRVWRNFLKSDPTVELIHMTVLRPPEKNDNTKISELSLIPFPIKELFEEKLKNFNLIIFDNFRGKNILTPLHYENLISFVHEGGAILEITGPSYNSKSSLFRTQVGRILPGAPTGKSLRGKFKPRLTDLGSQHPITKSIFENYNNYGFWYEMNDVVVNEKNSSILLNGLNNKPLLSVSKIDKGRIAQIYSHNIWIWKNNEKNPGPHRDLIKNLAHWLMKEPELEEDRLSVSIKDEKLNISKVIFRDNSKKKLEVSLFGPNNQKEKIFLEKLKENTYSNNYKLSEGGVYLVTDNSNVKLIETNNYATSEMENLNINTNFIKNLSLTNSVSKVIRTKKGEDLKFKLTKEYSINDKDLEEIFLIKNSSFQVKEITKNKLFNIPLFIAFIIGLFFVSWKKESS